MRLRDSGGGYHHEDTRIGTGDRLPESRSHLDVRSSQDTQTSPYLAIRARRKNGSERSTCESH